jgi:hypothetical protein
MHKSKILPREIEISTLIEYVSYYHSEIILYASIALIFSMIPRICFFGIISVVSLYYLSIFDWLSWAFQNKPFSIHDISRFYNLIIYYPDFVGNVSLTIKLKTAFLILFPLAFTAAFKPAMSLLAKPKPKTKYLLYAPIIFSLIITPLLYSDRYLMQNTLIYMASEYKYQKSLQEMHPSHSTVETILGHSNHPEKAENQITAKPDVRKNIIFFVIETGPYKFYPDLNELKLQVKNSWFIKNSHIFNEHYTTYPASDRSIFSLTSGKYPPLNKGKEWKKTISAGSTFLDTLKKLGYRSYVFSTAPFSFYGDHDMYKNLGFENMYDVNETKSLRSVVNNKTVWDREKLYRMDEILIEEVLKTIENTSSNEPESPFVMLVAPQSSHAPFQCPPDSLDNDADCTSDAGLIKANATYQFNLLSNVVTRLEKLDILEKTVIVVTADHGLRSKQESNLLGNQNYLNEETYHVPLMITGNSIDINAENYSHPTTHIDLAPTIMDLIDSPYESSAFDGRSLLDTSNRTIYFIGGDYSPANGFLDENGFYMENRSSYFYYLNNTFNFTAKNVEKSCEIKHRIDEKMLLIRSYLLDEYKCI